MTRARIRPALTAGLALVALLTACTAQQGDDAGPRAAASTDPSTVRTDVQPCPAQPDRPAAGKETLPELRFDCLGGGRLDLAKAPGVPMVVNLWGSWCGPCREELPLLQQYADAVGDRVRVVGVVSKDGVPQAASFAADAGVTFPSAFDGDGELMSELGLRGLPFTYLVDADGGVAYTQVGPVSSVDELRSLVADHLGVRP